MHKAKKSQARLLIILGREWVDLRVSGIFDKAVVQSVLIFGAEMWVMTPCMGRTLWGFITW